MSSWVYRKQIGIDAHLVAWLEVRLYTSGIVEVLPWVENGFLTVTGPTNKSATYTFTVGGTQRFSAAIDVKHHTRIPLLTSSVFSYWLGADPGITVAHDTNYLMVSGMVPNYATGVDSGAYTFTENYTTNMLGDTSANMGNAGYSAHIGVLPQWAAVYLAGGGDARAYRYVIANGFAAGSWPIHYRNESTNQVPTFAEFPSIGILSGGTPSLPAETGGVNQKAGVNAAPDTDHQPSLAYLPYLLTGRPFFLEEHLFWTFWNYARTNQTTREGASSIEFSGTGRGRGWNLRNKAQALAIVPVTHSSFNSLKVAWEANVSAYRGRYINGTRDSGAWQNSLGCTALYSGGGTSPYGTEGTYWWDAPWMQATIAMAFGHGWDLGLPQSSGALANHLAVRNFAYKQFTDRAGDGSAGTWNYRRFSAFALPYSSPSTSAPGAFLANWAAAYTVYEASGGTSFSALSALPGGTGIYYQNVLVDGAAFASSTATCFNMAALAFAAEHQVPGAAAGWLRVTSSSSYAGADAAYRANPNWAIKPRALPSFVPNPGFFADLPAASNTTMNSARPTGWPTGEQAGPLLNWSTGKYLPDVGEYGAYALYGSGHLNAGDALYAGVFIRPLDGISGWQVPTSHAPMIDGGTFGNYFASTQAGSIGWPYPGHQYTGLVVQSEANGGTPGWGNLYTVMLGGWGGSGGARAVYKFDFSTPTVPPVRVIDEMGILGSGNSYPACIEDHERGGWWTLNYNGNGPLIWTDFATHTQTTYPGSQFNDEKDYQLGWAPELKCLIAAGGTNTGYHIRVNIVTNGVPSTWVDVPLNGTTPPNALAGIEWCPLLGKFAAYEHTVKATTAVGPEAYYIHWLTPPSNLTTGTWTWSQETLAPQGGATIYHVFNPNSGFVYIYATRPYSKFRWVPKLKCFVFCEGLSGPTKLWRPSAAI